MAAPLRRVSCARSGYRSVSAGFKITFQWLSSGSGQHCHPFQVHGGTDQEKLGLVGSETPITDTRPTVEALHASEDLLDRAAPLADRLVPGLLPLCQRMMLVGPCHRAILDASHLELGCA